MKTEMQEPVATNQPKRMEKMQAFFDELEVRMNLGRKDFQDLWVREMKDFRRFFNEEKSQLIDSRQDVRDLWDRVGNTFNSLDETMDKVEMDMEEVWKKQQPEIKQRMQALLEEVKDTRDDFGDVLSGMVDRFRNRPGADVKPVEFMDEKPEASTDRMDILKKRILDFQNELKGKIPDDQKVDHFKKEVGDSFDRMKKAFNELFA